MGWIDPTDRVNGDVLDANLWNQDVVANTLAIFRHLNPVGTVIPYAGDWGTGYGNLADPDVGAPFHLPCTGGVYDSDEFPLLSRVLTRDGIDAVTGRPYPEGHLFVDGLYGTPQHGMIESGQDINGHSGGGHLEPFWDEGGGSLTGDATSWRPDTSLWLFQDGATAGSDKRGWHRITLKGFAVPDMLGRSPVGAGELGDLSYRTREWRLGERWGDKFTGRHGHNIQQNNQNNYAIGRSSTGSPVQDSGGASVANNAGDSNHPFYASWQDTSARPDSDWMYVMQGLAGNIPPGTGLHFLIFTGQVVPPGGHKPMSTGLRDGSAYRIQPVTTEQMIHQRLADPNISDDEREMLTAQLNGEPWPPMEVS